MAAIKMVEDSKEESVSSWKNPLPQLQTIQRQWIGLGVLIILYLGFNFLFLKSAPQMPPIFNSVFFWAPLILWGASVAALSVKTLLKIADTFLFLFYLGVNVGLFYFSQWASNAAMPLSLAVILALFILYFFLLSQYVLAIIGGLGVTTFYLLLPTFASSPSFDLNAFQIIAILLVNVLGIVYKIQEHRLSGFIQTQKKELRQLASDSTRLQKIEVEYEELQNQAQKNQTTLQNLQSQILDLKNSLQLEKSLTTLAIRFIQAPVEEIDEMITSGLKTLCEYFEADRAYLYFFARKGTVLNKSHEYLCQGVKEKIARHEKVDNEDFSWFVKALKRSSHLAVTDIEQLPVEASTLKSIWKVEEVKSLFIVPLMLNDAIVGFIGLDFLKKRDMWPGFTEHTLLSAGLIFLNALERKRYKEHLRRSEGRIKMLFERSADVIYVTTPEGKILDMNPAGVKLLGYNSLNEVLKLNVNDLYWNVDDRKKFRKAISKKGFVKDFEIELKNREGRKIVVMVTASAVTNEQGKVVAYEGIMRDVTEKKQLEHQLFQAQKMESIGLLTGSIAHDFNNILTAVNGYAEMIRRGLPPDHPQQVYVQNILRSGRRAENLIRQLLAFSRKQIIEPRVININQIIDDLKKMLRQLISEDIELQTELAENILPIKADPGQIEQVLVNLIINSRDALNQIRDARHKKLIKVQTRQVSLDEEFVERHPGSRTGDFIRISISDNGVGIPLEIQSKIFEPFFTTKGEGKGTGLGLSTVYGIIKQNEGSIYLESEPGRGATFHIYWPVSEEREETSQKDDTSEVSTKAEEYILVVEDDPDVRELACTFLTNLGYKVFEAENGAKALELIEGQQLLEKIDLVFSDMVMPIMGGDQLAEEIKARNPNIKILLTSGYTDSQLMKTGLISKGYHFLHKPYTIQQMAKKVRRILDNQE